MLSASRDGKNQSQLSFFQRDGKMHIEYLKMFASKNSEPSFVLHLEKS